MKAVTRGVVQKFCVFLVVSMAYFTDVVMSEGAAIRMMVVYYYIVREGIRCFENLKVLGVEPPEELEKAWELLKGRFK